jgi:hypothetical protein
LSSQLEMLRQRHSKSGTNRGVLYKIAAIQRVISEVDAETDECPDDRDGHSLNNVIAAVTDKIVCAAMGGAAADDGIGDEQDAEALDMSVESSTLNHSLSRVTPAAALDDKTHFTNEISV